MESAALAFIIYSIVAFIFGVLPNAFIFSVGTKSWIEGGRGNPVDLILSTLGLFNVIMQSLQLISDICNNLFFVISLSYYGDFFYAIFCGTVLSSSWVTAWLCTFYCVRIISFQHRLVTYLKLRFHTLLPRLLSGSIMLSYSLLFCILILVRHVPFTNKSNSTQYTSEGQIGAWQNITYLIYGLDLGVCVPLVLILMTLGLAITSLSSHVLRLHSGSSSISVSQLKAHVKAVITMTLLLILQTLFYTVKLSLNLKVYPYGSTLFWICILIHYYYYALQALTLICGNNKLSLAWRTLICLQRTLSVNE